MDNPSKGIADLSAFAQDRDRKKIVLPCKFFYVLC
jgi:hypothetical protein